MNGQLSPEVRELVKDVTKHSPSQETYEKALRRIRSTRAISIGLTLGFALGYPATTAGSVERELALYGLILFSLGVILGTVASLVVKKQRKAFPPPQ